MTTQALSRRAFLRAASDNARNSLLILSVPSLLLAGSQASAAALEAAPFTTLSADEAAEFAAIAARIIPTDETPGATEAGAIYFMDNVLGNSRAEILPSMQEGLAQLQSSAASEYGSATFHTLSAAQQDTLLQAIEDTPFFNTLRYLTIAGMFSLPSYGGNRDLVGWQLLGFEDRHYWQAPYGYYDAEYMETGA